MATTVHVGEFTAPNYPSLEGGFSAIVDSLSEFMDELKAEYAVVDEPTIIRFGAFAGDYQVKVYETNQL